MPAYKTHKLAVPVLVPPSDLLVRQRTIAGLRALADFLEANPTLPLLRYGDDYTIYTDGDCETCGRAEVDRVAALLGVPVHDDTDCGGHYSAAREFGHMAYRIVHIPARHMAEYQARNSYHDNITLTPDDLPADLDGCHETDQVA